MTNKDIVQNVGTCVTSCVTMALTIPIKLPEWTVREISDRSQKQNSEKWILILERC